MYKPPSAYTLFEQSATVSLWNITLRKRDRLFSKIKQNLRETRLILEKSNGLRFNGACACGRNHKSVYVGGRDFCPLVLLMRCNNLAREGCVRAADLLAKNKKESIVQRIDPETDAIFVPEPYSTEAMLKKAQEWTRRAYEDRQ